MKYPKTNDQKYFMGKPCLFTGEYCRVYKKKRISNNPNGFGGEPEEVINTPIKWEVQKHKEMCGWIVGFGFCFNGTIVKEGEGDFSFSYFRAKKRVNYVRVRVTPQGKELKIPLSYIKGIK